MGRGAGVSLGSLVDEGRDDRPAASEQGAGTRRPALRECPLRWGLVLFGGSGAEHARDTSEYRPVLRSSPHQRPEVLPAPLAMPRPPFACDDAPRQDQFAPTASLFELRSRFAVDDGYHRFGGPTRRASWPTDPDRVQELVTLLLGVEHVDADGVRLLPVGEELRRCSFVNNYCRHAVERRRENREAFAASSMDKVGDPLLDHGEVSKA